MKSFGILYKGTENQSIEHLPEIELHINLWDLTSVDAKQCHEPCIDFGLQIDDYQKIDTIQFYFPFQIENDGFYDLYDEMANQSIASLIFNDSAFQILTTKDDVVYQSLIEKENRILLRIAHNTTLKKEDKYSILNINLALIAKGTRKNSNLNRAYFRFRIVSPELKKILWLQSKLDNNYFESAFISKQIIDMKINEPRNMEEQYQTVSIQDGYNFCKLKKIHFLLAEPASATSTFFGQSNVSCRTLEDNEWNCYLRNKYNTRDALVYHVKSRFEEPQTTFSCLVKSEIKDTDTKLITKYILIVILLGASGSALWEAIKYLLKIFLYL